MVTAFVFVNKYCVPRFIHLSSRPKIQILKVTKRKQKKWGLWETVVQNENRLFNTCSDSCSLNNYIKENKNKLVYLNGNNAAKGENNIKYASSYPMN